MTGHLCFVSAVDNESTDISDVESETEDVGCSIQFVEEAYADIA